jgi:hypothetical protein
MDNPEIALSVTKDTEQIQTKQKTQQRSLKILATQTPHQNSGGETRCSRSLSSFCLILVKIIDSIQEKKGHLG